MIPRLVAVSPGDAHQGRPLLWLLEAMAGAGLPAVILREPELGERAYVGLARGLAPLYGAGLILHGKHPCALDIASAGGFGLHLPAGADLAGARVRVRGLLGASCHDGAELARAHEAGCDYAVLSPVFAPASKPGYPHPPLGLDGFTRALVPGLPTLALGGITPARAAACARAGASGVAVLGGLFPPDALPEDRVDAVRAYLAALG